VIWLLACARHVPAPAPEAAPGRCPAGVEPAPLWVGEYPGPVVEVTQAVTLPGRAAPCDAAATLTCTVPPGLYHPWSTLEAGFVTLSRVQRYRATRAHEGLDEGEIVEVTTYLAEGYCRWRVRGRELDERCPEDGFEELPAEPWDDLQTLGVDCREGRRAWLDAPALLATPGVREGVVLGYGEIGPAGAGPGI
jgi:hypothetical protein